MLFLMPNQQCQSTEGNNHLPANTKQNKHIQTKLQKMLAAAVSVTKKHTKITMNSIFPTSFGLRNFFDFADSVSSFTNFR